MKKITLLLSAAFIFILLISGCGLREKYERQTEMPLPIKAGQKLIVKAEVGSVKISDSNRQGSLNAKITGRGYTIESAKKVAEDINITIEENSDKVIIKINKPSEYKSNWFTVDLNIHAPQDINIDCKTDVGSVTVSNIKGDIASVCDVGSITCEKVVGKTTLKTNVGDIRLIYADDANAVINADLSVNVGSIRFKGPKNIDAKFDAKTDVGSINSSLPLTIKGDFTSKKISGTIGQGQGNVVLKTDVGSIRIE